MNTLQSQINPRSQAFADNTEHMQSLVDDLEALVAHIKQGGGERYQARHQALAEAVVYTLDSHSLETFAAPRIFARARRDQVHRPGHVQPNRHHECERPDPFDARVPRHEPWRTRDGRITTTSG